MSEPAEASTDEPEGSTAGSTALAEVVPLDLPVVPGYREVRDLAAMAVTLSHANCVPGPLRGQPNNVFMVLLTGRDIGIKLTTALRMLHVIDGQVTIPPKVKLALVRERRLGRVWPDPGNDREKATWYAIRADDPEQTYASTVTFEQASAVQIGKKDGKPLMLTDKDNWRNYPDRMLSWRALGYLLDDAFSEVGTGLYSPDELGAVTDEDGIPLDVIDVDPFPGMKGQRERPEEPISREEAGQVLVRIGDLPDAGRDVLRQAWKEKRLFPPEHLRPSMMATVNALLEWVEQRARGGEWGPWPPQPQSEPGAPPADPDQPESAADGPTAAAVDDQGDPPAHDHLAQWAGWKKTGRCVYCTCGDRLYQGQKPKTFEQAEATLATMDAARQAAADEREDREAEIVADAQAEADPATCLHPDTVQLDDGEVCVACGERLAG